MKEFAKRTLARLGWSLNRVPTGIVTGVDLRRDLALVVGSRPGPACVDAGANVGQFIDFLNGTLCEPLIHAFEPAPEPFAQLQSRHGASSRVKAVNAGLGRASGQISFNVYDNQTLNSALRITPAGSDSLGGPKLLGSIPIAVHALDDYAASAGLERVDLLKIDTQGYELEILMGAGRLLGAGRVRTVLLELNFVPLYDGQVWAHEVMALLHGHGFFLVDLYEKCRLNPLLGWCTALFTIPSKDTP